MSRSNTDQYDAADGRTAESWAALRSHGAYRWTSGGGWIGGTVLLVVFVALWDIGGLSGIAAWIVIASSWLLFPPIVPVAVGQFAIVALTASGTGLVTVLPVEASLLALLAVDLVSGDLSLISGLGFVLGTVALAGSLVAVARTTGLLFAGCLALLALGGVSYALHRCMLLDLGHLTVERNRSDE